MALIDGLVGYWNLDEASGNAADSSGSGFTLTDTGVSRTTGHVSGGTNAGNFNGSSDFMAASASSVLAFGDVEFTVASWFRGDGTAAVYNLVCGKWDLFNRQYRLGINGSRHPAFAVTPDGTTETEAVGEALDLASDTDWHLIIGWHDPTGNVIACQFDNQTPVTAAYSSGVINTGAAKFRLGSRDGGDYWGGDIDDTYVWDRILTTDERTELWGSGNGTIISESGNRRRRLLLAG